MPYQPGHPYHPPKDHIPGRGKLRSKHQKELTLAVRAAIGAQVFVDYHKAIAMGRAGVKLAEDEETGDVVVVWDTGGSVPTQDEITKSVNWLADRGHGLPAQSIQVQASVRAHMSQLTTSIDLRGLSPAQIAAMRGILANPALATALPAPARVLETIDAHATEEGEATEATMADANANE